MLRRPLVPRPMTTEAAVMTWVRDQGYPCPEVVELVDDGLVMERVEGTVLLDLLSRRPHRMRRYATLLGDLHGWLHLLPGASCPARSRWPPRSGRATACCTPTCIPAT